MKIKKVSKSMDIISIGLVFRKSDQDDNLYLKIASYSSPIKAFNLTTNELVIGEESEFSDIKIISKFRCINNDYHFSSFENANIGDVFIIMGRKDIDLYIKIKEPSDNILPDFNVFNLTTDHLEFIDPDEEIKIFEVVLEYED